MEYIVIIPVLNPEPCLEGVVDRLWDLGHQTILVNDGSDKVHFPSFRGRRRNVLSRITGKTGGRARPSGRR